MPTVGVLIVITIILAFAGVNPLSNYKNTTINSIVKILSPSPTPLAGTIVISPTPTTDTFESNASTITLTPTPSQQITSLSITPILQTPIPTPIPTPNLTDALKLINDARSAKKAQPINTTTELNQITDTWVKQVYGTLGTQRIPMPSENYLAGLFVIQGSKINTLTTQQITNYWLSNVDEVRKLTYPFLGNANVGLSILRYPDCIICSLLVNDYQVNMTDKNYWDGYAKYYNCQ